MSNSGIRVAVIGLGSMGFGMATSLKRAGLDVTGCDVAASAVEKLVALGGSGAATPAEAAKDAAIVVSVVVNGAQTEAILFGKDGAAETMPPEAVFVSSATMDPMWRGALPNSSRPPAGITWTRRYPEARSARRKAN
jgi:putative dehydrogenase